MVMFQILAKYNIMGLGLGLGVAAMAQMRTNETPSLTPSQGLTQQRFETTNLAGATVDSADRRFSGGSGGGSSGTAGATGAASGGGQNDLSKVQSFFYR